MKRKVNWLVPLSALSIIALTGCNIGVQSANSNPPPKSITDHNVLSIFPTPKGLVDLTGATAQGEVILLAGNAETKGLYDLQLTDGSISRSASVSNHANSVVDTNSGTLVMSQSTSTSGAIQIVDSSTLKVTNTIPVGGAVLAMTTGTSPNLVYVLNGNAKSRSVTIVNTQQDSTTDSIPVSLGTIQIATDGSTLYALQNNGQVEEISIQNKKVVSLFPAVKEPITMVLSPDGTTLYILKQAGQRENIAVIDLAIESQTKVLPAPNGANALSISADGTKLYLTVNSGRSSNLQLLKTNL